MHISLSIARKLTLQQQGLDGRWAPHEGKEGVAQTIEHLGYVQIDTIAVVQRAHHHTLWTRHPEDYDPQMLHELQAQDRRIFEWWAPAMSYVPMSDYRYHVVKMGPDNVRPWQRKWHAENKQIVDHVLTRIRDEGPLGSADFKAPADFERGTWWSWKPAKQALEVLFDMGELMVTERRNFQRIYDLRERVLPPDVDTRAPAPDESARFWVRRVLGGLGFAAQDRVHWRRWGKPKANTETVAALIEEGEVTPFEIEGIEGQTFCALTSALEAASSQQPGPPLVHILNPFDSLIIRRGRLNTFFGFVYKFEAYTPAAKRQYGYFCLPILWGERFVGRMDAKADRKPKTFIVRKLIWEPDFSDDDALLPAFVEKLRAFTAFNGCERIVVEQTDPEVAKDPLVKALGSTL